MIVDSPTPVSPRWLHALAVLTALFTLPLLFLGASVTSHDVGMIDEEGFRAPWVIVNGLFEKSGLPWRLEYGHRTFGFLVGMCGIALALGCFLFDRRAWMGWFALGALGMICMQGLLGINRVEFNAQHPVLYKFAHGVFAQLVFATLVSVALFTSRRWSYATAEPASPALQRWSAVTVLLVFLQLLLGAVVRHQDSLLGPRGHLLGAFVTTAAVLWLTYLLAQSEAPERFRLLGGILLVLLGTQLLLGMESWLARFHVEESYLHEAIRPLPMHSKWVRTLHYVVGSLIFATTASVALLAQRTSVVVIAAAPVRELEGVA